MLSNDEKQEQQKKDAESDIELENVVETEVETENESETASNTKKSKVKKEKKSKENAELEKLKKEYSELSDKFLRICAEYDNFRKRSAAEKSQVYNNAVSDTISAVLPVVDNMDRALAQENASAESLQKGLEMIYNQFKASFETLGVKTIGEIGEDFNPEMHNAVSHIDDEELGENVIAQVLQKGYILKDERVVRHAMVQVAN